MIRREPFADQQDDHADEGLAPTRELVARAFASHLLLLNDERTPNYRVAAAHAFDDAKTRFLGPRGEPLRAGDDPLFDRMLDVMAELESSPQALRVACEELLRSAAG